MSFLKKKQFHSMFGRSFGLIVIIVMFSLLISGVFLLVLSSSYWKERTIESLENDVRNLAQSAEIAMENMAADGSGRFADIDGAMAYSVRTVAATTDCDVLLTDAAGNVLLCGDADGDNAGACEKHAGKQIGASLVQEILNNAEETYSRSGEVEGFEDDDYLFVASPVVFGGEARYCVILMKQEEMAFKPLSAKYGGMVIFSSSIAVLLSLVAAYIVSVWLVKPLKKIGEATNEYAKGNFHFRLNADETYVEIQDLVKSVNGMADSLEVMEDSRSNFVANVSHELKTPMTIISGFIDGILDGTIPPEEHEKYLRTVSAETKRLSRLVVDMLNMAKVEAGRLTLNESDVELRALLLKIILLFEDTLTQKNIAIFGLDTLEKTVIRADEALLYQVFFNLVDNAAKFTPDNGTITVRMAHDKKTATVTIRNTGRGIPEEECGLVFDRFYKVDKSRGLDSKSFGVGLHIAKRIIDLHKGDIRIKSRENEYTEFVVELPVQPSDGTN